MDDIGRDTAEQHDTRCQDIEPDAALSEGREETRTDLKTDRIDEEDESEILGERLHQRMQRHAEMAGCYRAEKDPRDTDGDAFDL